MNVYETLLREVFQYRKKYLLKGYREEDVPAYSIPESQYWDFKKYMHFNGFLFSGSDECKNKNTYILGIEIIPYQLI
jgi:hypothetical protein